jgi:hypothetical protein
VREKKRERDREIERLEREKEIERASMVRKK